MTSVDTPESAADPVPPSLLSVVAVVCLAAVALSLWASAADPVPAGGDKLIASLHESAEHAEQSARLSCYDGVLAAMHPARGANAPVLLHQRP